ncbi:tRNA epoxyqueuosine(34) reductase QueG [Caminicella sporogenes]|uniref:tRNA epoxyqueuosine(34) reductase QueG n=1 Tax=Caminicella sporogenes TaxID=166485 RepID=UPI0025418CEB|nr:tRNA epoxyqueuosine(34) reductase QueG [Caminicella sporogenes]WIF94978.1 tRNA epoxyqueuosine(34) reductase QueG [Caminicella sporogenes]
MDIKKEIIRYSQKIGIDLIGFIKAEPLEELRGLLNDRKSKNYLSGFEEEDIEKRINPALTMKEANTIIVIAMSYYIDDKEINYPKKYKYCGYISRSAWGMDYHIILKDKMEQLISFIKNKVDKLKYKYFVDTGPLVDRYLAYKANIGWYGKNNCIINKDYGSWIFIGYILCNLDIESDKFCKNSCLSCNKCINSCPTGALKDNYNYNAKKCISYLTQTKEEIDYSLREKMGNNIYGCDTCQSVCPHNQKIISKKNYPNEFTYYPNLLEILEMSNKEFKEKYKMTAAGWRGKNIIRRNALIAIGNIGDKEAIDVIKKYLNEKSIMIRKYTAWAILKLDRKRGKNILIKHLKVEKNSEVIEEINNLFKYFNI